MSWCLSIVGVSSLASKTAGTCPDILSKLFSFVASVFILYLFDAYEMYNLERIGDMEVGQIPTFFAGWGAVLKLQWLCYA